MEAFDMAHKLSFAGRFSPVPFTASPIYITSQIVAPQLGSVRVFIPPQYWNEEAIMDVAREIASTLGPTEQFDVGIALETNDPTAPGAARSGEAARLTKIDSRSNALVLRLGNSVWRATYPRLQFEPISLDEWRAYLGTEASAWSVAFVSD
jgi:hypothetical protein